MGRRRRTKSSSRTGPRRRVGASSRRSTEGSISEEREDSLAHGNVPMDEDGNFRDEVDAKDKKDKVKSEEANCERSSSSCLPESRAARHGRGGGGREKEEDGVS